MVINLWQCILVSEEDEEATFVDPKYRGKYVPSLELDFLYPSIFGLLKKCGLITIYSEHATGIVLCSILWMDHRILTVVFLLEP